MHDTTLTAAPHSSQPSAASRRAPRAFSLIELLVVIVILVILTGIAITLATRVTQSGRASATANIIKSLDATLTVYMTEKESFPSFYEDGQGVKHHLVDGRHVSEDGSPGGGNGVPQDSQFDADADYAEPTIALYALIASELPDIAETLQGIDSTFAKTRQFEFLDPTDTTFPNDDPDAVAATEADQVRNWRRIRTAFPDPETAVRNGRDEVIPASSSTTHSGARSASSTPSTTAGTGTTTTARHSRTTLAAPLRSMASTSAVRTARSTQR